MTDYPQYPTDPSGTPAYGAPPAARGPRPSSVDTAVKLIWAAVALSVIGLVISLLTLDEAVDMALEADTTGTLTESTARSGVIVFTVLFAVVGVALYALLAVFIGKGANWARIVFTVLAAIFLLFGLFGLLGEQPLLSLVLSLVQMALTVATLVFLFRSDSNAWFKAR